MDETTMPKTPTHEALRHERPATARRRPEPVRVTEYPGGPLVVRGDFTVVGADGEPIETGRIAALCRCGRSALKPLCDGNHNLARGPSSTGR